MGTRGRRRRSGTGVSRSGAFSFFRCFSLAGSFAFPTVGLGNHSRSREKKPVKWSDVPCERNSPIIETARAESQAPLKAMANRKRSNRYTRRPARPRRRETTANAAAALLIYEESGARYGVNSEIDMSMEPPPPPPPVPLAIRWSGVRIALYPWGFRPHKSNPANPTSTGGKIHAFKASHRNFSARWREPADPRRTPRKGGTTSDTSGVNSPRPERRADTGR